jgi:hypothetical protein
MMNRKLKPGDRVRVTGVNALPGYLLETRVP